MRRTLFGLAALTLLAAATPALAISSYLTDDQGVKNGQHYCKYGNGKVYTFSATSLCPLSVKEDAPQPAEKSREKPQMGGNTGFYKDEYIDDMTKVCVYNVIGQSRSIRIKRIDLCPMQYDF